MKFKFLLASLLLTSAASAQYTNTSSVLDGSGTISTGGTYINISAAGQPGGISVSDGDTYVNQAGFLNTFFAQGSLDTDGDGIPDEADLDNDNDGLRDATEIAGTAFSPATGSGVNTSDSDGDGMNDGREALAGSDPTDANAAFELVRILNTGAVGNVTWLARGNNERTYVVKASSSSYSQPSQVLFSNSIAGGSGPWYQVTNSVTDDIVTNGRFYAVEVVR
ncbi:MAG: thrombospondin type 3 repeat-containing protein [bacterium]